MKIISVVTAFITSCVLSSPVFAQPNKFQTASVTKSTSSVNSPKNLYIDVHHLGAGNVNFDAVAKAHAKDLAVEGKHGVNLIKYWVDEKNGTIMCLAEAPNADSLVKTHKEAHGLLPDEVYQVTAGKEEAIKGKNNLYLDVHKLGAGNVTAEAVAGAHQKDLAVEKKYGVNLINYWVDEKTGTIMCLAQAPDSAALINTHKEAHGLVPVSVVKVKQGQ